MYTFIYTYLSAIDTWMLAYPNGTDVRPVPQSGERNVSCCGRRCRRRIDATWISPWQGYRKDAENLLGKAMDDL